MLSLLPDDVLGVLMPHVPLCSLFVLQRVCRRVKEAVDRYSSCVAAGVPRLFGGGASALWRYSVAMSVPPVVAGADVAVAWGPRVLTRYLEVNASRELVFNNAVLVTGVLGCTVLRRECTTCPLVAGGHWLTTVGITMASGGLRVLRFSEYDTVGAVELVLTSRLMRPDVQFVQVVATHHPIYNIHVAGLDVSGKVFAVCGTETSQMAVESTAAVDAVFTCLVPMQGQVYALQSRGDESKNDMRLVTPTLGAHPVQTCPHRVWASMDIDGENLYTLGRDVVKRLPLLRDWLWVTERRRLLLDAR
jgi:hypothetical protein